jgi:hypothetical protein
MSGGTRPPQEYSEAHLHHHPYTQGVLPRRQIGTKKSITGFAVKQPRAARTDKTEG